MCVLSHVQLFVTSWTVAHQALLSMGFPRQEYWSGLPFPPPGDLPDPGIEPTFRWILYRHCHLRSQPVSYQWLFRWFTNNASMSDLYKCHFTCVWSIKFLRIWVPLNIITKCLIQIILLNVFPSCKNEEHVYNFSQDCFLSSDPLISYYFV